MQSERQGGGRPAVITIDGPAGVGKGTLAARLARHLGFDLLDSGALYRVVGLAADRAGLLAGGRPDEGAIAALARALDLVFEVGELSSARDAPAAPAVRQPMRIRLDGEDVTDQIRSERVGGSASVVAALPQVRQALLGRQREAVRQPGLVADGRDMGSVVFPDACVKLFLSATPQVRAARRYNQLKEQGVAVNLDDLVNQIAERDRRDRMREASPLVPAHDAVQIDTSELGLGDVFAQALAHVERAGLRPRLS